MSLPDFYSFSLSLYYSGIRALNIFTALISETNIEFFFSEADFTISPRHRNSVFIQVSGKEVLDIWGRETGVLSWLSSKMLLRMFRFINSYLSTFKDKLMTSVGLWTLFKNNCHFTLLNTWSVQVFEIDLSLLILFK